MWLTDRFNGLRHVLPGELGSLRPRVGVSGREVGWQGITLALEQEAKQRAVTHGLVEAWKGLL